MKLYIVVDIDDNGENRDTIIEARDPAHAAQLWRDCWNYTYGEKPDNIGEIQVTGEAGVITWGTIFPEYLT